MEKMIRDVGRKEKIRKYMKNAVAIVIVTVITFFTICISSEAARHKIFKTFKNIYEDCTEYFYDTNTGESLNQEPVYIEPTYLPDGYKEVEREEDIGTIFYQKPSEGMSTEIEYYETIADGLSVLLDTEGETVKKGEIAGTEVEYFVNKGCSYLYWTDEDTYYSLTGCVDMNEIMKMGESIIKSEAYKEKNNN